MNVFDLEAVLTLDTSEYDQGLSKAGEDAKKTTGNAAAMQKNITTAALAGAGAMAAASTALVTKSIKSYAEYEQLVGGIETLYKSSANTVMQYANEAYKTAGMSANQYMETATSFAAALTQSLGGDTAKAAEYANTAITDMSDNANKMGTSIDSIVQTYQSLSRGNFAMLDNLKLGYGGTKAELERLLEDAERYKAAQGEIVDYSIDSYSDIVEAIHVVQQEMGITGTTAAESASTIEGSFNTAKAAAENFFTSLANPDADVSATFDSLVDSVSTVAGNVIPVIGTIADHVWDLANSFPAVTGAVLPAAVAFGAFAVAINVVPAINAARDAILGFNAVLAANPIGLAIALMAGLAVATYNLVTHFTELYTEADKAAEGIRNLNRATESGVSGWVEQENAAKESMSGVQSSVESAASGVSDALGAAGADSGQAYRDNLTNALSGIDADLADQISAAMDGTASAVEGASTQIGEAGTSAVEQYASAFQNGEIGNAASNAVTQAVDAANGAASNFATVGQSIATQISTGINSSAGSISTAVSAMLTTAIVAGNVATGAAAAVGQNVGAQLAQGIHAGAGTVSSAIQNIVTTAITTGNAATSAAVNIGQNIGTQIASGASSGAGAVAGAVRGVVATAIVAGNAATGGATAIGANIARGIAAGISSGSGAIAAAARSAVQAAVAAAKAAAAIHSPSQKFRDEVGVFMGLGIAEGLEDSEDEVTKAAKKLAEKTYSTSKEWLRRQTKFNKLSLAEQLEVWQEIQSGYLKESKQWIQAEEEIFDLREKIQSEFATDVEKIWKDITDAQDKYADALTDRIDDIAGAYKLFDDVQDREAVNGQELTDNLTRQVNVLNDFYGGLDALAARGVSGALVEEIRDMGPKAVDNLDALLAMTDEELSEYADLFGQKQAFANRQALKELEGLKAETDAQIKKNMQSILDLYDKTAPTLGEAFTDGLAKGILDGVPDVVSAAVEASRAALGAASETMFGKRLSFAKSGLGMASAGMINTVSQHVAQTGGTTTINLVTPDGGVLARYVFDPLKAYAAAKGQPIVNPA